MSTSDDSVREIQLSGKQLVFLFMAVTVVSVGIFLCGVLVGRGVQAGNGTAALVDAPPAAVDAASDPTAPDAVPPDTAPAGPTAVPDLKYQEQLESDGPAPERLAPPGETAVTPRTTSAPRGAPTSVATPPRTETPVPRGSSPTPVPAAPAVPAAPNAAFREPRGDGFAIQVAALSRQAEAEAIATRLKSKGYAAFILSSLPGQPPGFKVRVGKFKARGEAEKIATKLEREEQFKPWITR